MAFTLTEAERRNNRRTLKELRAIGPPPHTYRKLNMQRKWLLRFVRIAPGMSVWKFLRITLGGPGSSICYLPNILRGVMFSGRMWPEVSALNPPPQARRRGNDIRKGPQGCRKQVALSARWT